MKLLLGSNYGVTREWLWSYYVVTRELLQKLGSNQNDENNSEITTTETNSCPDFSPSGDVVEFSCKDGFQLTGQRSVTCTSGQFWDHAPPTCTAAAGTMVTNSSSQVTCVVTV